jgi:hypothetical protein
MPVPTPWSHEATLADPVPGIRRIPDESKLAYTSSGLAYEQTSVPAPGLGDDVNGAHGGHTVLLPRFGPPASPDLDGRPTSPAMVAISPAGARRSTGRQPHARVDAPPHTARTQWILPVLAAMLLLSVAAYAVGGRPGNGSVPSGPGVATASADAPAPTQPATYFVPLTASATGWPVSASAFFRGDGYHITHGLLVSAPVPAVTNFDVAVQVTQISGATSEGFGLAVRVSGQRYDAFLIYANGTWQAFRVSGTSRKALAPARHSDAIARGLHAPNLLDVQATGDQFTLAINGQMLGQVSDGSNASGGVGLVGAPNAEVAFSNFALSSTP